MRNIKNGGARGDVDAGKLSTILKMGLNGGIIHNIEYGGWRGTGTDAFCNEVLKLLQCFVLVLIVRRRTYGETLSFLDFRRTTP